MNTRRTVSGTRRVAARALAACLVVFGLSSICLAEKVGYVEQDKAVASDGAAGDYFGLSVSVSGDTAIVGAQYGDSPSVASGSAYIFRDDGTGNWNEIQELLSGDGVAGDRFGASVAVSGNTAVVGAYGDDDSGSYSGSAYIFQDDGAGNWIEIDKLLANDGVSGDYFGMSVGISGDTVIVGAFAVDDQGTDSGAAYIFQDDGAGNWAHIDKLLAADGAAGDEFGRSVSISGDTVVIGAWGDDDNGADSGAAYIFQDDGAGDWTQIDRLAPGDGAAGDYFGTSVSINDDAVIVGAFGDDDLGAASGSAYVFEDDGTGYWAEVDKLLANDGVSGDQFGISVAIAGDTAIVGAFTEDALGADSGSAYVFQDTGTTWQQNIKLTSSDGAAGDYFAASVSISDAVAILGVVGDDDGGSFSGSAYMFTQARMVPLPGAALMGLALLTGIGGAGVIRRRSRRS